MSFCYLVSVCLVADYGNLVVPKSIWGVLVMPSYYMKFVASIQRGSFRSQPCAIITVPDLGVCVCFGFCWLRLLIVVILAHRTWMSKQIKKLAGLELAQELFRLQLWFCILAPPYSIL